MNMIMIHKKDGFESADARDSLFRFAIGTDSLTSIIFNSLSRSICNGSHDIQIMIPHDWGVKYSEPGLSISEYDPQMPVVGVNGRSKTNAWFAVCQGRFLTRFRYAWLCRIMDKLQADVVAVTLTHQLQALGEKTLIGSENTLVGFRRYFDDSARLCPIPGDWPHCLFIKTDILDKVLVDGGLPLDFTQFINHCKSNSMTVRGLEAAGAVLDLNTQDGLIGLLRAEFKPANHPVSCGRTATDISDRAKIFGDVIFGQNVCVEPDAIIVGPAIIGSGARIGKQAVVQSSIIGPGVVLPSGTMLRNRVLRDGADYSVQSEHKDPTANVCAPAARPWNQEPDRYRKWPAFSYAGFFKRVLDVVASFLILLLFLPVIFLVIIAIKVFSPGPIFFEDKRQGLHGKPFNCLKFRTMIVGADNMQEKIRRLNQVDVPQFRIEDDPRISVIGKYLRDTYLDEVPQFINVLFGQMSIVGPRPSPESENTLCPSWRDARLSVRPGVTGLWQIYRTRQPMQDFQEWIYYDIQYVKNLSVLMDFKVCLLTAKKMFENLIRHF